MQLLVDTIAETKCQLTVAVTEQRDVEGHNMASCIGSPIPA